MAANFLIPKDETFRVTIPIDVSRSEPQIIFASTMEDYPAALQAVESSKIEYHWCEFKRPAWGEDCLVREMAFSGDSVQTRSFSPERLDEARVRYFLKKTSLLLDALNMTNNGGYETLASVAEEQVKRIKPFVIRAFLGVASRVWDFGISPKNLLDEDDYKLLRDDEKGLEKVSIRKGLFEAPKEEEAKKKLASGPERLSTDESKVEATPTLASS